jgi:hypothetical protein
MFRAPKLLTGAVLFFAAILIGCASSLPPAQPATSLKSIAGNWEGHLTNAQGEPVYAATLVIREDGTYESSVPALKGSPFTGTVAIQDGKFRWTENKTGTKGDFVLHEGNGKRVLIRTGQGVDSTGEYEPAK